MLPALLLAQITPDTPDTDVLSKLAEALGAGKWFVAAPLIVFAVVKLLRIYGPAQWPWLGTSLGGLALAAVLSLFCSIVNVAIQGTPLTLGMAVGMLLQVLYGLLPAMGIQSGTKALMAQPEPMKTLR